VKTIQLSLTITEPTLVATTEDERACSSSRTSSGMLKPTIDEWTCQSVDIAAEVSFGASIDAKSGVHHVATTPHITKPPRTAAASTSGAN
jgi:hypothetical protein